jgi:serine/threonine protein kinase/tetratricopeptide (TPR) repeat protein
MAADPQCIKALFAAALDVTDPQARQALLARECAGDDELRHRLEALLQAHERPQPALDQPLAAVARGADATEEQPGTVLAGKYKLVERLAEGGMGSVWLAQQQEPVKRAVAVKLIKRDDESRAILARFEAERQALALMDHPNIAKVLDGGTTERGAPFFVMELVKGVPITRFCDERKLTPKQRLELFIPVCQAIQHAHQKGIIHRDIKPSNVLVALYDDKPVPKVIDFGLAKATGPQLTEQTLLTGFGALVGTPQYMSPEQATLNNLDIDTRSDIYSLGVLLYELLAGSPPFGRQQLEKAGMLEVLRVIREEEPPRPSVKLSSDHALPSLAANRSTEPGRLTRLLRGEIDWIVMKALEKERARRYETANAFALDIARHLADEPVQAGPPRAGYRLRKFVKRHTGQVVAVGLVLLALLGGIVGTTLGLVQAEAARQAEAERADGERRAKLDAEQAAAAETKAKDQAERRLRQVEKGASILAWVFHDLDPKTEEKEGESLRVLLGRRLGEAVKQLEGEAVGDALVVARLQLLLGNSLRELGHFAQAEAVLTKAARTLETSLKPDHPDVLDTKHHLAFLYQDQGKYSRAETLYKEVLQGRTARHADDHPHTLIAKNNLAQLYQSRGMYAQAEKLYKEVLEVQTARQGADHPHTLNTKHNLALLYQAQGKYPQAEALYKVVLEGRIAKLGANHPYTLLTKNNLATLCKEHGEYARAETLFKEVLAVQTAKLGIDHPNTLTTRNNLAVLYGARAKHAQAEALLKEVLEARRARLGADHPDTLHTSNNLALSYTYQGKHPQAEKLFKANLEVCTAKLGADHPETIKTMHNLAHLYRSQGKYEQAETIFKEVLRVSTATLGPEHPGTLATKNGLARLYQAQRKYAQAETLFKEVLKIRTAKLGTANPSTVTTKHNLAALYWSMKKLDHAIPLFEEVALQQRKNLGTEHPDTLQAIAYLGVCYRDVGRLEDSIRCLEEVLAAVRKLPGPIPAMLAPLLRDMVLAYDRARQYAKSEPLYRQLLEQGRKQFGGDDPRTAGLMAEMALNLLRQKKHAEAETTLRDCLAIRARQLPEEWQTFSTRSMLGEALLGQKKYTEAEPLLKDGYQGLKQRQGTIPVMVRKLRLTEALLRLVALYNATGSKDEAARWRKELAALQRDGSTP